MTAPLDAIFPRPVLVELAGTTWRAGELTFGDLATLQSWLRQASRHPLDGLARAPADRGPDARRARLLRAWREAKEYPPTLGGASPRAGALLDTREGRAVFLVVALSPYNEGFDAELAELLEAEMGPEDWARLRRVAYAVPPWRELAGELDPPWLARQARESGSRDADWAAALVAVARANHLDIALLEDWTPTRLRLFCAEGKPDAYRAEPAPGESREDFEARMAETFRMPGMPDPGESRGESSCR